MEKKNEFIWNDDNLIKPRCLKCFILFPIISKPEYYFSGLKYNLECNYCRYKDIIDLCEYLKFIKSNNIQIPLCSQCNQNPSTYINIWKHKYFCNNCINQNKIKDYKKLKNNFNSYYCKKHNKSFRFINNGEPYCEICYSNLNEHTSCGPLSHSYPVVYHKIRQNLENLKKDKIYIEKLITELKTKYPESENKKFKKDQKGQNDDEDDEFTFSDFNEYYHKEFLVNINSLIEFIEILLPNYNPSKLNENLSKSLELFIYYRKIADFNYEKYEKSESKWYFLYEYLYDYFNPFDVHCLDIDKNKIFQNKLKFEINNNSENIKNCVILKDGRIAGIIGKKICIFDIEKTINNTIKFDIVYNLDEEVNLIIELDNLNLFLSRCVYNNNKIYKIENNTLIKIKELDMGSIREIINLTKNRISISFGSWGYSVTIYDGYTLEEIKTLPTKDYPLSCCQVSNKEILALSILHECTIDFWSLEDYSLVFQIKNINPGIIMNYKKDKIICSSDSDYAFYVIDTNLFRVENIFKFKSPIKIFQNQAKIFNGYLFMNETITLLNNDTDNNKYFQFNSSENYSYLFKEDNIIINVLGKNELYNIKKENFFNLLNK